MSITIPALVRKTIPKIVLLSCCIGRTSSLVTSYWKWWSKSAGWLVGNVWTKWFYSSFGEIHESNFYFRIRRFQRPFRTFRSNSARYFTTVRRVSSFPLSTVPNLAGFFSSVRSSLRDSEIMCPYILQCEHLGWVTFLSSLDSPCFCYFIFLTKSRCPARVLVVLWKSQIHFA